MKRMTWLGLVSVVAVFVALDVLAGVATPATIIVMPARRRMVELANQITRIKDVGLVAYSSSPTSAEPLIHIWNGTEWLPISVADYAAGAFMSGEPKHLFLLGDSSTLPEALSANPAWCSDVHRITELGVASLLNEMNKTLKFTPRQWEWLAKQNRLILTDKNVERRRYGRWGAPKNEAVMVKPKASDDIVMPPAPIQPEVREVATPAVEVAPVQPIVKPEPVKEDVKAVTPPVPVVEKPADPVVKPPVVIVPADK
jgi:hypothetical protein